MPKEFMFYVRNASDAKTALSPGEHLAFIKQCEVYIGQLKSKKQLIAAQPILPEGLILKKTGGNWTETPVDASGEVQVGYYHIVTDDLKQAIEIAKQNPEFAFVPSATIEIRPVKTKEAETNFVYPK